MQQVFSRYTNSIISILSILSILSIISVIACIISIILLWMNDIPLYRYATFSLYSKYPRYEPSSFELSDIQTCIPTCTVTEVHVSAIIVISCILQERGAFMYFCTATDILCRVQWCSIFISKPRMSRSQHKSSGGVADTAEKEIHNAGNGPGHFCLSLRR